MSQIRSSLSWGIAPLLVGVLAPSLGCSSKAEKQTYDPVPLGMVSTDTPFYDDGETTIYQVKRPVSLPIIPPNADERKSLRQAAVSPWDRTPWITKNDIKVQVSWTLTNLDADGHNVELLLDPWTEFARYVPGVNVGEETTIPDLSGIDLSPASRVSKERPGPSPSTTWTRWRPISRPRRTSCSRCRPCRRRGWTAPTTVAASTG